MDTIYLQFERGELQEREIETTSTGLNVTGDSGRTSLTKCENGKKDY
jgi:hypothetical protein